MTLGWTGARVPHSSLTFLDRRQVGSRRRVHALISLSLTEEGSLPLALKQVSSRREDKPVLGHNPRRLTLRLSLLTGEDEGSGAKRLGHLLDYDWPVRVKGLLIDLDGTIYTNNGPIEGACEALERLDRAGIAYRS